MRACFFCFCLFSTSFAALAADDIKTSTEEVKGSAVPFYVAEGVIDAPPADVWAIVSKCADYSKNMPAIASSEELAREGDETTSFITKCKVMADLPFPLSDLLSISRAVHTVDAANGNYTRKWVMLSGDYDVNEGSWSLSAVDGGKKTKAVYRLRAKPKIPLPEGLVSSIQKDTLPKVIANLRERTKKK